MNFNFEWLTDFSRHVLSCDNAELCTMQSYFFEAGAFVFVFGSWVYHVRNLKITSKSQD